jgi:hypothetical protein
MADLVVFSQELTTPDRLLLKNLTADIIRGQQRLDQGRTHTDADADADHGNHAHATTAKGVSQHHDAGQDSPDDREVFDAEGDAKDLATLKAFNDPENDAFAPTVFVSVDLGDLTCRLHPAVNQYLLQPYIKWAQTVARKPADVVMITHLILYFTTSVPSALFLFRNFSYLHGILHVAMQFYYVGTYTLMMHQHIHMRGILSPRFSLFDRLFPYVTDPLMGHTWNTYYYHHVKHHHVESNGPDDLSSTLRYQRDSLTHFLCYLGRFYFLVWLELPLYFLSRKRPLMALQAGGWELASYGSYVMLVAKFGWQPTFFVFIFPLLLLRIGLMVGNWGQHAFVDADEPDSDYRSSITLIDVPVSFCALQKIAPWTVS